MHSSKTLYKITTNEKIKVYYGIWWIFTDACLFLIISIEFKFIWARSVKQIPCRDASPQIFV